MKNKAFDISRYAFTKNEPVLLDANIWLYLFPAPSNARNQMGGLYSAAFKNMMGAHVRIAMDALVLSEYLNRYCRIEWNVRYKTKYSDFKKFRKSTDFLPVGSNAAAYARMILKHCAACDTPFASADINSILAMVASGSSDFNDELIIHNCRKNGWKLITNDTDMTMGGIEIVTGNRTLFQQCQ